MAPVGEAIRALRDRRRLTQRQLAERSGVSLSTVHNWESGKHDPSSRDLARLAEVLGVRVATLLDPVTTASQTGPEHHPTRGGGNGTTDLLHSSQEAGLNVRGRVDELRHSEVRPMPVYRWGSLGDPRDDSTAPAPDREEYPPLGRERLIGPRGFGVEVRGDSMVGRDLHSGDVCWVNPDRSYRYGNLVLALVSNDSDDGMVVKTYARAEVGDCLMSEGIEGKSPVVCREFTIIGPVVWVQPAGFPPG